MTPEQLARRRASREAWRARNPLEWRARRARKRSGSFVPDAAGRSGSPAALRAEAVALLERFREIEGALLANQTDVPDGPAVRQRSGSPAARPAAIAAPPPHARQSVPPPERVLSPAVAITTTTPRGGLGGVGVPDRDVPDVFSDAEVRAAIDSRPGLDVRVLRSRVADWLRDNPTARLNVRTVLSFVERWRPPSVELATSTRGAPHVSVATDEYMAQVAEWQQAIRNGEQLVPAAF